MAFYRVNGGEKVHLWDSDSTVNLLPWNSQLLKNTIREQLISCRPQFFSDKKRTRVCKDKAYDIWEQKHVAPFRIKGNFTGLLGDHPGEIYAKLSPHIRGTFTNCEIKKKNFKSYSEYQQLVKRAYPEQDFQAFRKNILTYLQQCNRDQALVDLDMMWGLGREGLVEEIVRSLDACLTIRSSVMLWHCIGRTCGTDKELYETIRPKLLALISMKFNILKHTMYDYWEGYPMRVDMLTLERKAA